MTRKEKNNVLLTLAGLLKQNEKEILDANQIDMDSVSDADISMKDRLKVDGAKVDGMIQSLQEVAQQVNPEGKVLYEHTREDGLHIINKTVPFGTILIIYESRPDVTIEAAATAFKAGNRILLKGGRESLNTNSYLTELWQEALTANGFEKDYVQYLNISREETQALIKDNTHHVDLIIPRGGDTLIKFVTDNSSVPVIVSGRGNNFVYVDDECDTDMAISLILNGKQRISVCNAIDKVLINKNMEDVDGFTNKLVTALNEAGIEVYGTKELAATNSNINEESDPTVLCEEFLAPKMYLAWIESLDEAVAMVNKYSGGHSSVIVTTNADKADQYMQHVDSAAVYHNASSRFTDGGQLGVGAEIAISTQKIHFRGPLGAQELVTNKWFVYGKGQIRH